ncbi:DNA glycosylase AlkZ-like family protein [Streptomyces sp. NPDC004752]
MTASRSALHLSPAEARRTAIASALLDPAPDTARTLDDVLHRLLFVQTDAISTLAHAQHLTLATRITGTTTHTIDHTLTHHKPPAAFEYPAHALALVPLADWPLWAFRRRATRRRPEYPPRTVRTHILNRIRHNGPLTLKTLRPPGEKPGSGWDWGPTKQATEIMLWAGDLICVRRTTTRQRLYDLPEHHLPPHTHTDALSDDTCLTTLLTRAARTLGIATTSDLADYLRIPTRHTARLLPDTPLTPATVHGWKHPAWTHPDALPAKPATASRPLLLGPFDNLLLHRPRVQRLFAFTHVLEAYKPATRRRYGYYVCPLLTNDRLTARADLTRTSTGITVLGHTTEPDAPPDTPTHLTDALMQLTALTCGKDSRPHQPHRNP